MKTIKSHQNVTEKTNKWHKINNSLPARLCSVRKIIELRNSGLVTESLKNQRSTLRIGPDFSELTKVLRFLRQGQPQGLKLFKNGLKYIKER